ncbi:phBC6A51 family helix-turn-helix protein [Alkalihalobacillus macyae]|uniref:phBC6A51 family helix-turn-helix protein n=1 Tax=Guptibacillus hwajinpoensis TaxID=208199 RepID=UPI00273C7955|nr:phBC6A51 family helix-turn-helix protein [Alkalihalobacillus macyae]MDP4550869.1 phBC6A51 family helix-turn-helix protein [Alkalihalobacillus macyae]
MGLKHELTADQWTAISYLAQPNRGGKELQEIADEIGIHRNTLTNWRKKPDFQAALKGEIVSNTHSRLPEVFGAMADHAIKGNAAMAKLILQANGMLVDKAEISTTVSQESDGVNMDDIRARIAAHREQKERIQ